MQPSPAQTHLIAPLRRLTFLSAFALFFIEPVVGEILTPSWGGIPAIWLSCLLFFQTVLFLGYIAIWIGTSLFPKLALPVYCLGLATATILLLLAPLPLEPGDQWVNTPIPSLGVFGFLGTHLFLVTFCLSGTATLTQFLLGAALPGRVTGLYSFSNAGSFLALLAYPLLMEPFTTRQQQLGIFTSLIGLQTTLALFFILRNRAVLAKILSPTSGNPFTGLAHKNRGWWLIIPLSSSALLCGVTNHLATEVASVPFLWILPLALYLLSYVIAYSEVSNAALGLIQRYTPIWVVFVFFFLSLNGLELSSGTLLVPLILHLGCFFLLCILLHHLLANLQPENATLGAYYAIISFGGLLGTLLQALVFPMIFARLGIWEYPLAIAAALFLLGWSKKQNWALKPILFFTLGWFGFGVVLFLTLGQMDPSQKPNLAAIVAGILFVGCLLWAEDCRVLATSLMFAYFGLIICLFSTGKDTEIHRNSFGIMKITTQENHSKTLLYHGNTIHGIQSTALRDPEGRFLPLSYYGTTGPAGDAMEKVQKAHISGAKIGIIGLGVGSLAWYGRPQDHLDFMELDPAVGEIAQNPNRFQFLDQALSSFQIQYGDGRRTLANSKDSYDLLILDAFSSDTVPVHLLTQESLAIYLARLEKEGSLLCHVSNRHFDLLRVMAGWEKVSRLRCYLFDDTDIGPDRIKQGFSPSQWVLFTKDPKIRATLETDYRWQPLSKSLAPVVWTDNHHSILGLLKW